VEKLRCENPFGCNSFVSCEVSTEFQGGVMMHSIQPKWCMWTVAISEIIQKITSFTHFIPITNLLLNCSKYAQPQLLEAW